MKRITNALVAVVFSLCLLFTTVAPASAAKVGKVTGLTAATTPTSVTLSWTKVAGATGYHVQQQVSKKWKTIKTITKAKTVKYKVTNLKADKTYKFRVRAYIKKGKKTTNGAFAKINVKTVTPQVTGVKTTAALKQITANWTKVAGATGYEVVYSTSKKFTKKTTKTVTIKKQKTVKTTIKNLKPAKTYYVKVRAYTNVNGKKKYGAYSTVSKIKTAVPAVTNLAVKAVTYNTATISWKKVANAGGYQIEKNVSGSWVKVNHKVGKGKTQFTLSNLPSASKVQIRIRAYQKVSSKTYYGAWQVVSANTSIGAASGLSYSNLTASAVKLTWKAAPGAAGYYIQNNGKTIKTVKGTSDTLSISSATAYKITVVPYNGVNKGLASNAVSFTSVPGKVTGTKASSMKDSSATVSWTKVTGAAGYQLQYSKNASSWTTLTTTATSYVLRNLDANTSYSFRVRAYNKNGSATQYGEYSAVATGATTGISAASASSSSASLKWAAVSGAKQYVVQFYNTETSAWEDKATVSSASYNASDLGTAKAGLYRIVAKNSAGNTIYTSEGFTATTTGYTVTQDNYKVTISWPSNAGVTQVIRSTQSHLEDAQKVTSNSVTYYLAPGLVHTFKLISGTTTVVASFGVEAPAIDLGDTSDGSVNGQLLYLTEAINRTKTDRSHNTTVNVNTSLTHSITSLAFGIKDLGPESLLVDGLLSAAFGSSLRGTNYSIKGGYIRCNDAASVAKFCEVMNEGETEENKMLQTETSTDKKSLTFSKGNYFTYYQHPETGKTSIYYLDEVFEPSSSDASEAYLYNGNTPSAWKNGFSSVKTTKTANGYKIVAVLKAETTPNYHNGFITTFSSSVNGINGMDVLSSSVGASTLTAEIDSECRLLSYKINSPYKNNVGVDMSLTGDEADTDGVLSGDIVIEMSMAMEGKLNYEYTFSRTK